MANSNIEDRLNQLEALVAEQDKTIEDLNSTITSQWTALDKLKREFAHLTDQVEDIDQNVGPGPQGEKPPHY